MKVSIVTAVYNRVGTLPDTIESVLKQTYPDIEYIVVDGMSTDGTDEVISKYSSRIDHCVREKDKGIYDALNKGIRLATGDVVGLLHADDFFSDREVVESIAHEFKGNARLMGTYGDLVYVDSQDVTRRIRNWKSGQYDPRRFKTGWMPPHPTVYLRRDCYAEFGVFRDDFQIAADYELLLRMMFVHQIPMGYIPRTLVSMRVGGKSNASLANRLAANREDRRAWKVNGLRPPMGLRFLKPLRKLAQYF